MGSLTSLEITGLLSLSFVYHFGKSYGSQNSLTFFLTLLQKIVQHKCCSECSSHILSIRDEAVRGESCGHRTAGSPCKGSSPEGIAVLCHQSPHLIKRRWEMSIFAHKLPSLTCCQRMHFLNALKSLGSPIIDGKGHCVSLVLWEVHAEAERVKGTHGLLGGSLGKMKEGGSRTGRNNL